MAQIKVGKPVSGTNFIGRAEELKYITELLQLEQNVVLIAPRRYGKTSLVLEALTRINKRGKYTALIDIFSIPNLEVLAEQITQAVLKNHKLDKIFAKTKSSALSMIQNLKLKTAIEDFEFILGFSEQKEHDWDLLGKSIDFVNTFPKKHKKKMVCAFDEFGDIKKLDGNKIVKLFRSKLQLHENAAYIFSGSYESVMSELFIEKNAPFFRFARIINLGKIEKSSFLVFYKRQLKKYNIGVTDEYINSVLNFTGGHPYYSQLALQELIIYNALNKKTPSYTEIFDLMISAEKNYLEKTWEEISSKKELLKTILAVCRKDKSVYSILRYSGINISRALKTLTLNGMLFKTSEGYELTDPLLEYWINQNVLKKYN
jgi:AAA+ ATPase superfamily predicted ATPase